MDPGPTNVCDTYALSSIDFLYLPRAHRAAAQPRRPDAGARRAVQHRGRVDAASRIRDKDVSDELLYRTTHGYAMSPDGQRLAQLEASLYFTKWAYKDLPVYDTHVVIRDLSGKLLHEYKMVDNGEKVEGPALLAGRRSRTDRRGQGAALGLRRRAEGPLARTRARTCCSSWAKTAAWCATTARSSTRTASGTTSAGWGRLRSFPPMPG